MCPVRPQSRSAAGSGIRRLGVGGGIRVNGAPFAEPPPFCSGLPPPPPSEAGTVRLLVERSRRRHGSAAPRPGWNPPAALQPPAQAPTPLPSAPPAVAAPQPATLTAAPGAWASACGRAAVRAIAPDGRKAERWDRKWDRRWDRQRRASPVRRAAPTAASARGRWPRSPVREIRSCLRPQLAARARALAPRGCLRACCHGSVGSSLPACSKLPAASW